jgi:hypothetical protein
MKNIKTCLLLAVLLLVSCGGSDTASTDSKSDPFKSFLDTQSPSDGFQPKALKMDNSNAPSGPVPDPFRAFLDAQKNQTNQ